MGKTDSRMSKRRQHILDILPTKKGQGKTYDEIAAETEYSVATVRGDLDSLRVQKIIGCDDSRRPFKWFRIVREK